MIVSIAIAVLPVERSPMISSRCPLPIGMSASIARMPVCSGCLTGWRCTTAGATFSIVRKRVVFDRALAVDRLAERIDDAAEQRFADGHRRDAAGAAHFVAFFDFVVGPHDHDADVVLFEVQRDALQAVGKLDQLGRAHAAQPVDAREIRADLDDGSDLVFLDAGFELSICCLRIPAISSAFIIRLLSSTLCAKSSRARRRDGRRPSRRCGGRPS